MFSIYRGPQGVNQLANFFLYKLQNPTIACELLRFMQLFFEIQFIFVISNDRLVRQLTLFLMHLDLLNWTKFPELKGQDNHFGYNLCSCFIIYKKNFLIRASMFYYINNILVDISMEFLAVLIYSYLRTSKNLKQIVHIIKGFFFLILAILVLGMNHLLSFFKNSDILVITFLSFSFII